MSLSSAGFSVVTLGTSGTLLRFLRPGKCGTCELSAQCSCDFLGTVPVWASLSSPMTV